MFLLSRKTVWIALMTLVLVGGSVWFVAPRQAAPAKVADMLITGGTIVTIDASDRVIENGFVAIRGERIVAVGTMAELRSQGWQAKQTIDARGKVVLPGLINTHTHIPMVLFRGIADDLNLQDWLTKYIFPAEAKNVTTKEFVDSPERGLAWPK